MSQTMVMATIQTRLSELGYYTGDIDNEEGTQTRDAVIELKRRHGYWPRPYIGPITIQLMFSDAVKAAAIAPKVTSDTDLPPWYLEIL